MLPVIIVLGLVLIVIAVLVLVALGIRASRARDDDDFDFGDRPAGRSHPGEPAVSGPHDVRADEHRDMRPDDHRAGADRRVAGAPRQPVAAAPEQARPRPEPPRRGRDQEMDDDEYWSTITFDKPKFPWRQDRDAGQPQGGKPGDPLGPAESTAPVPGAPAPAPLAGATPPAAAATPPPPAPVSPPVPAPTSTPVNPAAATQPVNLDALGLPVASAGRGASGHGAGRPPLPHAEATDPAGSIPAYGGPAQGERPSQSSGEQSDSGSYRMPTVDELLQRIQRERASTSQQPPVDPLSDPLGTTSDSSSYTSGDWGTSSGYGSDPYSGHAPPSSPDPLASQGGYSGHYESGSGGYGTSDAYPSADPLGSASNSYSSPPRYDSPPANDDPLAGYGMGSVAGPGPSAESYDSFGGQSTPPPAEPSGYGNYGSNPHGYGDPGSGGYNDPGSGGYAPSGSSYGDTSQLPAYNSDTPPPGGYGDNYGNAPGQQGYYPPNDQGYGEPAYGDPHAEQQPGGHHDPYAPQEQQPDEWNRYRR